MLGYASVAMLVALRDGARYGLEIMECAGLPSGTVYPALSRMEERGLIAGQWTDPEAGRPRKEYALTEAGRTYRAELVADLTFRFPVFVIAAMLGLPPEGREDAGFLICHLITRSAGRG